MKSLPERPSLDSLRKQAKKLARDVTAGDAAAIARVRAHLPRVDGPLTQRNAQLVVAREYGYPGWQDLTAEVHKRVGSGLDWAAAQARGAIHNNDVERLKQLLTEFPALLSWKGDDEHHGLLGFATGAYGDAGTEEREKWFTRAAPAELLIDAGAVVTTGVVEGLLFSRAKGLLELFRRKGLLPHELKFLAALGDADAVRSTLAADANDLTTVNGALITACRFGHEAVAALILERAIALDPELGANVDEGPGRAGFIRKLIDETPIDPARATVLGPWKSFVTGQVSRALNEGDLTVFVHTLKQHPWVLGEDHIDFQGGLIGTAAMHGREDFIVALLDLGPALLHVHPRPPSRSIEFAITYGHADLVPFLTRIWPLPDDLPHAAGTGNLARVKQWFDASGAPALGDVYKHFPHNGLHIEANDPWTATPVQKVLDTALAWSVINHHFDVADFLLSHGADINTRWNSHEPASILHTLVFEDDYEAMQFLIDRGIDMTIKDYRWDSDARGWARYGKSDEKMAIWLEEAERRRAAGV
ncbi:MAG TPA: hypothetical protein VNS10_01255 [Gemmatimonadaceae bacterium]|nr:hypothetical protein [Gemmatimonadaceae bacterium]